VQNKVSPAVISVAVVVILLIVGYFAWRVLAPPSATEGGTNPYTSRPDLKPGENPNGSSGGPGMGHSGGMPGSGGPFGSSGGPR
jgi:hypothetical protein